MSDEIIEDEEYMDFLTNMQNNPLNFSDLIRRAAMNQIKKASEINTTTAANIVYNYNININGAPPRSKSTPPHQKNKDTHDSLNNTLTSEMVLDIPTSPTRKKEQKLTKKQKNQLRILATINLIYYVFLFFMGIANTCLLVIDNTESTDITITPLYFELYSAIFSYLSSAYPFIIQKAKEKISGRIITNNFPM